MFRGLISVLSVGMTLACPIGAAGAEAPAECTAWPYLQEISLPAEFKPNGPKWYDFIVPPSVFDQARTDLGDLRLFDAAGTEIPYALRIRRPTSGQQDLATKQFNRTEGPDQSSELTLDLSDDPPEHNEVEVRMPGVNYCRSASLEGSADNKTWRKLLDKNLVDFQAGDKKFQDLKLTYPPSRFRYLRLRVHRDPTLDKKPIEISEVIVRHAVDVPGEFVTLPARLGEREAVRAGAGPGSAWILDLGGAHQPCEKLLVEIADREFARDYAIQAGGLAGSEEPFSPAGAGSWSRRAGDAIKSMEAAFAEQLAGRLRLTVTDFRNPPLQPTGAQFVAPAREIVFERSSGWKGPLRLYYGNLAAEPPHFDLERNLPAQLEPQPQRLTLSSRQANPAYVPTPQQLADRHPWLVYLVLGAAAAILALILFSLGKNVVAIHDAAEADLKAIGQAPPA